MEWPCMACMIVQCSLDALLDAMRSTTADGPLLLPLQYDTNLNAYLVYGLFCSVPCAHMFATQCLTAAQADASLALLQQYRACADTARITLTTTPPSRYVVACRHRDAHQHVWQPVAAALVASERARTELLHAAVAAAAAAESAKHVVAVTGADVIDANGTDRRVFCGSLILENASVEQTRLLTDEAMYDTFLHNYDAYPAEHLLYTYRTFAVASLIELTKRRDAVRLWKDLHAVMRVNNGNGGNTDEADAEADDASFRRQLPPIQGVVTQRRPRITPNAINAALRRLRSMSIENIADMLMAQRHVPSFNIELSALTGEPQVFVLLSDVVVMLVGGDVTPYQGADQERKLYWGDGRKGGGKTAAAIAKKRKKTDGNNGAGGDDCTAAAASAPTIIEDKKRFKSKSLTLLYKMIGDRTMMETMGKNAAEALALPTAAAAAAPTAAVVAAPIPLARL